MPKKRNTQNMRWRQSSQHQNDQSDSTETIGHLFYGLDAEPITEELITELVAKGWSEKDIRFLQQQGCLYCRPRNSFIRQEF